MKEYNVQYQYLMTGNLGIFAESDEEAQETVASLVLNAEPCYLDDKRSDLTITQVEVVRDDVPEDEYKGEVF